MNAPSQFNDLSSPLALLTSRRSGRPREMVGPGPGQAELDAMLAIAARVPDHGKLSPWRFVVIDNRERFARLLADTYRAEKGAADNNELEPVRQFAHHAPTLVAVLFAPQVSAKVPLWEQELSAGAACMNLLHAAHAHGYTAGWLTGWAASSPGVAAGLGEPGQRVAGFIFIGQPGRPLEERPRPPLDQIVRRWA